MYRLAYLFLFMALLSSALSADTNGIMDISIMSEQSSSDTSGQAIDRVNISNQMRFYTGEQHGAIDAIFRDERTLGSGSSEILGLVGSLTNKLGTTVSFATVKAIYIEGRSATQTLRVSGIATATITPYGSLSLVGSFAVASTSDRLTITNSATGSTTYRIWISGNK